MNDQQREVISTSCFIGANTKPLAVVDQNKTYARRSSILDRGQRWPRQDYEKTLLDLLCEDSEWNNKVSIEDKPHWSTGGLGQRIATPKAGYDLVLLVKHT